MYDHCRSRTPTTTTPRMRKQTDQPSTCSSLNVSSTDHFHCPVGRFRLASLVQYVPLPVVAVGPQSCCLPACLPWSHLIITAFI